MNNLVFIDTNIFLDFYRIESREAGLGILEKIRLHKDIIITGDQVLMEFKKNRQKVIYEVYKSIKGNNWGKLQLPPVIIETKASKAIDKKVIELKRHSETVKKRFLNVLKNPSAYDPVYSTLRFLIKDKGELNLSRDKKIRFEIRELAEKRFLLGYPPRKKEDNSYGDAINWEWIINCAKRTEKGIIIVTRDGDYGLIVDNQSILNDWLQEEFKARVGRKRNILLTDRLAIAFKGTKSEITKKEEEAEAKMIEQPRPEVSTGEIDKIGGNVKASNWVKLLQQIMEISKLPT